MLNVCKRLLPFVLVCGLSAALVSGSPIRHASDTAQLSNVMSIDATGPVLKPQPVAAKLGSDRSPSGVVLSANSQYLTLDGRPWLPVMGEFHFSRYPEADWEEEILKMKEAGVTIISTYVIWIHHEEREGEFDWKGQRNLRHFVELCAKHGMYVYPRIGPWAHAEARNGGLPDWVLKRSAVRRNDPVYLQEVRSFYAQIAEQLQGLLWKDGGPVIGIQFENEYRGSGPGSGSEHIIALKHMAVELGLDVPLYTVTGWDGAAVPLQEVLPVYGGYTDAPWDSSPQKMPPNEVFAFHFDNRAAGSMGILGGNGQSPASTYAGTPYLTAELAGGAQDTYFRRPVIQPDDIAALAPVMLGSGANLLGYYMFQGGRNPDGLDSTLQESQATGYPTDVPVKSYDFQAPIGVYGDERESLRRMKLVNYFLNDFGDRLAPMMTRQPDRVPNGPADLSMPRVSARTSYNSGFLFFNNHVRGVTMPPRNGFQVHLKFPQGEISVPASPIALPSDAYGIWPVNLDLDGIRLHYATAQLFKRFVRGEDKFYFFFTLPGIPSEFAFARNTIPETTEGHVTTRIDGQQRLLMVGGEQTQIIFKSLGKTIHLVILSRENAESTWELQELAALIQTPDTVLAKNGTVTLRSLDDATFRFGVMGADPLPQPGLKRDASSSLFQPYAITVPPWKPPGVDMVQTQAASDRGPWKWSPKPLWNGKRTALAPEDADFEHAATWKLRVPDTWPPQVSNVFLQIDYKGDVARLYGGKYLLDDDFWNENKWLVGVKNLEGDMHAEHNTVWTLRLLPLPKEFPMYLEHKENLAFPASGNLASITSIRLIPQYQYVISFQNARGCRAGPSRHMYPVNSNSGH